MKHNEKFQELVDAAKSEIAEVTPDQVKEMFEDKSDFVLIDCREQSEWSNGHIAGAEYLGKGVVERDVESKYPNANQMLVFYCGGGYRSALVCSNLKKMGYSQAVSMSGGWSEWNKKGYPVE